MAGSMLLRPFNLFGFSTTARRLLRRVTIELAFGRSLFVATNLLALKLFHHCFLFFFFFGVPSKLHRLETSLNAPSDRKAKRHRAKLWNDVLERLVQTVRVYMYRVSQVFSFKRREYILRVKIINFIQT